MTCLSAYMYRQISKSYRKKSEKALWGGGGGGASAPQMYRKKSENALWGGGGNASGGIRKETSAKFGIHCLKFNFIMHLNPNF